MWSLARASEQRFSDKVSSHQSFREGSGGVPPERYEPAETAPIWAGTAPWDRQGVVSLNSPTAPGPSSAVPGRGARRGVRGFVFATDAASGPGHALVPDGMELLHRGRGVSDARRRDGVSGVAGAPVRRMAKCGST